MVLPHKVRSSSSSRNNNKSRGTARRVLCHLRSNFSCSFICSVLFVFFALSAQCALSFPLSLWIFCFAVSYLQEKERTLCALSHGLNVTQFLVRVVSAYVFSVDQKFVVFCDHTRAHSAHTRYVRTT